MRLAKRAFVASCRPASRSRAFAKKSSPPKLPDFSASASGAGRLEDQHRHAGIDLGADGRARRGRAPRRPRRRSRRRRRRAGACRRRRAAARSRRTGGRAPRRPPRGHAALCTSATDSGADERRRSAPRPHASERSRRGRRPRPRRASPLRHRAPSVGWSDCVAVDLRRGWRASRTRRGWPRARPSLRRPATAPWRGRAR